MTTKSRDKGRAYYRPNDERNQGLSPDPVHSFRKQSGKRALEDVHFFNATNDTPIDATRFG